MSSAHQRTLAGAAVLTLVAIVAARLLTGVTPQPDSTGFSAQRCMQVLESLLPVERPHPIGSDENRAVRDRVAAAFRTLGYEVKIDRAFVCNAHATCGTVENVIARNPAQSAITPAVLLVTHYDSVPAGPGAGDAAVNVAIALEIARAVKGESFRHPVVFLIDDGEEAGLLGAEAFLARRGLGEQQIAAVINLEARGTAGPSFLFETGPDNAAYAPHIARAMPRPVTTSLFPTLYDLLPNDTDLTIFRRAGIRGVNFAFIRGGNRYHGPLDDREHLDPRTVQHQGENALAAVRSLAAAETDATRGTAVWFDLLGTAVVSWPSKASVPLAMTFLLLAVATLVASPRKREAVAGAAAVVAIALLAAVAGYAIARLCGRGTAWVAYPQPAAVAMWITGLATMGAAAAILRGWRIAEGVALAWSLLAVAAAAQVPGGSYLFIVPAVFLVAAARAGSRIAVVGHVLTLAAAAVTAALWFPLAMMLHEMLGSAGLPPMAVAVAMVATTLLPLDLAVPRRAAVVAVVALAVSVGAARSLQPYTHEHPRKTNVVYFDDGSQARWLVSGPTETMRKAARLTEASFSTAPWSTWPPRYWTTPAPDLPLPPVLIRRDGEVIHVESQRGADRITVGIRGRVGTLLIDGARVPPPPPRFRSSVAEGWSRVSVRGRRASIDVGTLEAVEIAALDMTYGLPPAGMELVKARDASPARPSDDGDVTITMRRERLQAASAHGRQAVP